MPTSAAARLVQAEPRTQPVEGAFEIQATGASLLTALVGALIESLMPGATLHFTTVGGDALRASDVLLVNNSTGRSLAVFGSPPTGEDVSRHIAAGTYSLIGFDASRDELVASIESLGRGPAFTSASIVRAIATQAISQSPAPNRLTARELDIARLLAEGLMNREIAEALSLSTNTVRSHLQSISAKLGVSNRARLAIRARELGLI